MHMGFKMKVLYQKQPGMVAGTGIFTTIKVKGCLIYHELSLYLYIVKSKIKSESVSLKFNFLVSISMSLLPFMTSIDPHYFVETVILKLKLSRKAIREHEEYCSFPAHIL